MIPETVSELEGAVSIALVQKKPWIECDPEVLDVILRSDSWKKQGYIVYKNMIVYGKGHREESQKKAGLNSEQVVFAHSAGPGPSSPFASAQAPKIEGINS